MQICLTKLRCFMWTDRQRHDKANSPFLQLYKHLQMNYNTTKPPQRCPYFDVVVGLAWSDDPESYTGGSLLLVGSPMPDRSKAMTQTKRDTLALQVGGW